MEPNLNNQRGLRPPIGDTMRTYKYEHNMNFVSVILNNRFLDEALKPGPLPLWMVRRVNEGYMASEHDTPKSSMVHNWRTYHN